MFRDLISRQRLQEFACHRGHVASPRWLLFESLSERLELAILQSVSVSQKKSIIERIIASLPS